MALIKSKQADALAHDAIVLDLGDLRRQAKVLQEKAGAEAEAIIDRAHGETDHIRADAERRAAEAESICQAAEQRGFEEGFAKGHTEGLEAGRLAGHEAALKETGESLTRLQAAWVEAADRWDAERLRMLRDARQSLLTVAVRMAEKIVHRVPRIDPTVVVDQVAEAVSHIAQPQDAFVHLHPDDLPILEEALPQILQKLGSTQHLHLKEDTNLERGGCVVTSGQGRVDATLHTQLQRLVEAMLPPTEGDTHATEIDTPDATPTDPIDPTEEDADA